MENEPPLAWLWRELRNYLTEEDYQGLRRGYNEQNQRYQKFCREEERKRRREPLRKRGE